MVRSCSRRTVSLRVVVGGKRGNTQVSTYVEKPFCVWVMLLMGVNLWLLVEWSGIRFVGKKERE